MKGYLQDLDTVNFDPSRNVGLLPGLFREAQIRIALYATIYEITLSPNQVLDSTWLRESYSGVDPKYWPFIFTVHESVYSHEHPFRDQLLIFLRRSGEQAFIFSSLPDGIKVASRWGEFVADEGQSISDEALLSQATTHYGEIIEWATRLDAARPDIAIHSYGQGPKFDELYSDYLVGPGLAYLDPPGNRSEAYKRISKLPSEDTKAQFEDLRSVPDLISNIQYAISTQSRLVISADSRLDHEISLPEPKSYVADVILDLNGLLSYLPELEEAITSSTPEEISYARLLARKSAQEAWELLGAKKFNHAKRSFGSALEIFTKELVQTELPPFFIKFYLEPTLVPGMPSKVGIEIPPVSTWTHLQWFIKWKLRGLDKFVNIRKSQ